MLAIILTVLVCVVVGAGIVVIWSHQADSAREQREQAVLEDARRAEFAGRQQADMLAMQLRQAEDRARQDQQLIAQLQQRAQDPVALNRERAARLQAEADLRATQFRLQEQQRAHTLAVQQLQALQKQSRPGNDLEIARLRNEVENTKRALKEAQVRLQTGQLAQLEATAAATYRHCIALAGWEARAGHPELVADYLRECPQAQRRWEWYHLDRVYGSGLALPLRHTTSVRALGFSADGKRLAAAALDGTVSVRDLASGAEVATVAGWPRKVGRVVFSPGGDRFASVCTTSSIVRELRVHDFSGRQVRVFNDLKPNCICLALSHDGKRLAMTDRVRGVTLWDVDEGKELLVLPRGPGLSSPGAFSPDGKLLAVASAFVGALKGKEGATAAAEIKVYNLTDGKLLHTLKTDGVRPTALAFSPDGKLLASATSDRGVQLWDPSAPAGEAVGRTMPEEGALIHALAFSPDSKRLFAGGFDGLVRIYDAGSGKGMRRLQGGVRQVQALAVSPDGARLAVGGMDATIRLMPVGLRPASLALKGHAGPVKAVAFSPDGKRLASVGADQTVRLWEAGDDREVHVLKGHSLAVERVLFSPDGARLATVSVPAAVGERAVEVKVWDVATGAPVCSIPGVTGDGVSVAFSASGKQLGVVSPGKGLTAYDLATGKPAGGFDLPAGRLGPEKVECVALSGDGHRLALADRTGTSVLIATPGGVARTVKLVGQPPAVTGLVWSADGTRLAVASGGRLVNVWNADPASKVGAIQGTGLDLRRAALSRDGQRLATAQGTQVALWDLSSLKPILFLRGPAAAVASVAFSPDGSRLAAGALDGSVTIWDGTPAHVAAMPR
jgi:WD40 repeat protein